MKLCSREQQGKGQLLGLQVFLISPPLWQEVGRWPVPDMPKAEGAWPQVGTHGWVQAQRLPEMVRSCRGRGEVFLGILAAPA